MSQFVAINDPLNQAIYAEAMICSRFYGVEQIEPIPPQRLTDEDLTGSMEKGVFLVFEEGSHRPVIIGGSRGGNLGDSLATAKETHKDLQRKWDSGLVIFIPVIWRDDFVPVLEIHLVFTLKPYLNNLR